MDSNTTAFVTRCVISWRVRQSVRFVNDHDVQFSLLVLDFSRNSCQGVTYNSFDVSGVSLPPKHLGLTDECQKEEESVLRP